MSGSFVVTIDGPASTGKSTVARKLATKLGILHLNSGALFRAVGLEAENRGVSLADDEGVASVARSLQFRFVKPAGLATDGVVSGSSAAVAFVGKEGVTRLLVNGKDWTEGLAGEHAGSLASQIGVLPKLRAALTDVQREIGRRESVVLEGRDAGTVVFPDARFKFYFDASLDVRANWRYRQLQAAGKLGRDGVREGGQGGGAEITLEEVRADIAARDVRDSTRAIAPQRKADDAVLIDTSLYTIDQIVSQLSQVIEGEFGGSVK